MKKLVLYSLLVLLCLGGRAQEYQALYRGKLPAQYPYQYNGTPCWEPGGFSKGSVYYNGKLYENVLLDVDACSMDLLARYNEDLSALALYTGQVGWFTKGNKFFVNLRYMGYTEAPEGYFEVLRDGSEPVLLQVNKVLQRSTGNHNGRDIGYVDNHYKQDIIAYFQQRESYYAITGGTVVKLRRSAAVKMAKQPSEGPSLKEQASVWKGNSESSAMPEETLALGGIGLPDGYFSEKQQETVDNLPSTSITATYRNKLYVIGSGEGKGPVKLQGKVTELETGDALGGVVIYDDNTKTYARSRADGTYTITLPSGENMLHYSTDSKDPVDLRVDLRSDGRLDVEMPEKVTLLKASVVSATSMENHRSTNMGVETVSIGTVNKIPSAFGEGDIMKAVLTLPGVKTVGEASGGFNVRGGSQDQNLILFNGNTIYNPSHLFGIFSAFNPDIVDEVELYKSSIPAEYGGRISSVLTVKSKEGNSQKFTGSVGIGLLTSRVHLEAPIVKGKTNFILGARTTYSDWILKLLPKNSHYSGGKANFTDANLGVNHHFDSRNSLHLNGYFATDRFSFGADTSFRYTNINASLQFRHRGDDGNNFQITGGYDHYFNRTGIASWEEGAYELDTYIRQIFLRSNWNKFFGSHLVSAGLDAIGYGLDPGILNPSGTSSKVKARSLSREYAVEPSLYVSDNWRLAETFSLEGGIRLSSFLFVNPSKFYIGPEFRVSARYSPLPNLSFKAGFNSLRQYIHLISNTSAISPMDTWKLSDASIKPTTGWQAAGGIYWTHLGSGIDFSLEGYWKQMANHLDYKPGAVLSMNENLSEELVPVHGRSWGVEAMVKKTTGALTGWISYSYSRARFREMQDRGAETIAGGNWYNAPYDKPHEVKMVANWAFTHRLSVSANLDYSTGRPVTVPIGQYYLGGAYRMAYSERNSYRIPDYFRLDLALNIDPGHSLKALVHTTITVGVYNVTGRKNPYSVFFKSSPSGDVNGYMLTVFGSQVPYVNLNILF